jgi:hypothetical protein
MDRRRPWLITAWVAVLALAAAGQHSFAQTPRDLGQGLVFYLLAAVLFIALAGGATSWPRGLEESRALAPLRPFLARAGRWRSRAEAQPWGRALAAGLAWAREHPRQCGCLAASAVLAYVVVQLLPSRNSTTGFADVVVLWVLSGALYLLAFVPNAWLTRRAVAGLSASRALAAVRAEEREIALVAGLTLLAGVLRFWALGDIPDIVSGDEGRIGALGLSGASGAFNPFVTTFGHSTLYLVLIGLPMQWGGIDPGHMRVMSALPGALTVPATYLLARAMFGPLVAGLAALIVAVNHFHLHFSRIIVAGSIMDALFATVAFWLLYRGVMSGRRSDWLLSGLVMALHLYIYMGARLVIPMTVGFVVLLWLLDRARARANVGNFLAWAGIVAVVGAPMGWWMRTQPQEFATRINQIGIVQSGWLTATAEQTGRSIPHILWQQLVDALLVFNYYPVTGFYGASLPMFDHLAGALLVLGAAYSLFHLREPRFLLLNCWVGAAVVLGGAALVIPGQAAYRVLIVFPAVSVLAALGAAKLYEVAARQRLINWRAGLALLAALAVAITYVNVHYYFREFMGTCSFEDSNTRLASRFGTYLGTLPRDYTGFLYGGTQIAYGIHPSVDFLSRSLPVKNMDDPSKPVVPVEPPPLADPAHNAVFMFVPSRLDQLDAVRARYPGGRTLELLDCGRVVLTMYQLPPAGG